MFFSLLFLLFFTAQIHSFPTFETHLTKSLPQSSSSLLQNTTTQPQQYFELRRPLPYDHLPPSCTLLSLQHNFSNTIGKPPISVNYSAPSNCTWSKVVLEFNASCKGEQYDRISAVWLDGVELLRTSTAEPTDDGIFWTVRKDVTRYHSLLSQFNRTLTVMLENVVDDVFTGVYHVNVTLLYYNVNYGNLGLQDDRESQNIMLYKQHHSISKPETPADLIIPISGTVDQGFWFRIKSESDLHSRGIQIPPNTYKAMLEIYVSFHGNDEFWYSNPPDSYIATNNLTTKRTNGAYREVFATIDGNYIGSVVPFPVIFTGGINPLFWEPIVGIGAFVLPSYDFDLTPFLGILLDGKNHSFGLGVSDSIQFWLVDANLHLWLDHFSDNVEAQVVDYHSPSLKIERKSEFKLLDGSFKVEAQRKSRFVGWVKSCLGNFTTEVSQDFKFKNSIKIQNNGTDKSVKQKVKTTSELKVRTDEGKLIFRKKVKRDYPLSIEIKNLAGSANDTFLMVTSVLHGLKEKTSDGDFSISLHNKQNSSGWMEVKDHSVLSGEAETQQSYVYTDSFGCYSMIARAMNGSIFADNTSFACPSFY